MEELARRVEDVIKQRYSDALVDLKPLFPEDAYVSGFVVSSRFDGKDLAERQAEVRKLLKAELGEGVRGVGLLFLHTPSEYVAMTEAQAA